MSEEEKLVKEIIKKIETSVKEDLDEYSFSFKEKFDEMLKKYVEGKLP